ncbi:phenylalanine--tRNA ligase subunit beta [Neoroseomonas oryzicola]|uniref:Phenylalanine--tRNA ligase beta subunit n=1 Tax=Neoroseomonas oryzicola TaxID=535904 RepID=A0A9X9WIR6_9PROT|nr:phenylalanine--tRNA ligase subunit beta [Neoroseomonas oryzicola]MBR0660226.1 phenylalanine--tRNA ligase subunit beta [Neoroseomonas oryzicola]NKE16699.1 phenylalanine--tRNA ligase subunit beta [Neoroseomonas oryzicola]
MKFTLSWLKDHLETEASVDEIARTLNAIGLEVEGIEDRGAALASFRIARVIEAVQHPNADRLRHLRVDIGDGRELSVVCGAPNARTGMMGVAALPGEYVPGTGITLKAGEIRGVKSEAMMLSMREMGLGDDHTGIVDLPADAPLGASYVTWAGLDDPIIEISVTPNRGDALSVRGVARDLAAAGLGTLKPWSAPKAAATYKAPLNWKIEDPRACLWVLGRAVRGVKNGPSPKWLQDRLVAIGLRPISALVDITNFFTFDLGRPLHVFDVAKVKGTNLTMRMARDGETLTALNGKDYALTAEDGVIADEAGPEALGGVIGGEHSGCDESTTECFIECALFDPVRIALSGRRHDVRTDARARFERGLDPAFLPDALEAATRMIIELCGGEASEISEAGAEPAWKRSATLRFERVASYGGLDLPAGESVARLERLGFAVQARDSASVTVAVPSWRNDVASDLSAYRAGGGALAQFAGLDPARAAKAAEGCAAIEPECDLVEEVLRLGGLDAVPAVSLPTSGVIPPAAFTPKQARAALARRVLAARGMQESVTFAFMEAKTAALFGATPDALRLVNPIAADLDQMRPTPVASLLLAASRNAARGFADVGLAELGAAYRDITPDGQASVAAGVRHGATPRHWAEASRGVDAMDAKGDALAVLAALGVPMAALQVTADAPGFYHPGRSGVVRQGPKTILATFGEIHPKVLEALDLPGPAVAFEVFLDAVAEPKRRKKGAPDLPAFQPLRRDFAFIVEDKVTAEALLRAARGADKALITDVVLFDVYRGKGVPEGSKSLAIQVTLQPREATLTDAQIEAVADRVVAAVAKATGAVLRA